MKTRSIRSALFSVVMILTTLAAAASALCAAAGGGPEEDAARRAAVQRLERAAAEARANGKNTVTIDLAAEDPGRAGGGDIVTAAFTARTADGKLIRTTRAEVAAGAGTDTADGYQAPEGFGPLEIVAGDAAGFPGLGTAVLGMAPGERRTLTLPPEQAYGPSDPGKIVQLPCEKRLPRVTRLTPAEYVGALNAFPVVGREVDLIPYFKARVTAVTESEVTVEFLAVEKEVREAFGRTEILPQGDAIVIRMTPDIGAPFDIDDQKGRIVMTDGQIFTVDLNPPMAGKPLVLEVEVVALAKAAGFKDAVISWNEDYAAGLAAAKAQHKPQVLVLYADWCSWSEKLLTETMADGRIKSVADRFVWSKIDSDRRQDIKARFGQEGFPMIVLLDAGGEVIKKIDGYRDAPALSAELRQVLAQAGQDRRRAQR